MIAFYCTIPHANSVPLPPRLNISLRYNFLSRLYHFRVLLRSGKKKGKEISCSDNFKKIFETRRVEEKPDLYTRWNIDFEFIEKDKKD